jgi:Tol biopolymer transport system component
MQFSNNGEFLVYAWVDYESADKSGFYFLKTSTGESKLMYKTSTELSSTVAISADRKAVLVKITDPSTYASDLWTISTTDYKATRLTSSSVEEYDARFSADQKTVFFTSTRDGKADIYNIATNGSSEKKVSNDGKVSSSFLGLNGLVFYASEKSLYVIDANSGVTTPAKVTENILNDSYVNYGPGD